MALTAQPRVLQPRRHGVARAWVVRVAGFAAGALAASRPLRN